MRDRRPEPNEPTRKVVIALPRSLADRLEAEATNRRSVLTPKISDARSRLVADALADRFAGALNPVATAKVRLSELRKRLRGEQLDELDTRLRKIKFLDPVVQEQFFVVPSPTPPDTEAHRAAHRAERAELRAADLAALAEMRSRDPDVLPGRWRALSSQVLSTAMIDAGLMPGSSVGLNGNAAGKARSRRRVRTEARAGMSR